MQVGRDRAAHKNWSLLASAQRSGYRHAVGPHLSEEQDIGLLVAVLL